MTDNTSAIVVGASISLINNGTQEVTSTRSTSTGTYVFESVQVGSYTVRVVEQGFREFVTTDVDVHVQQTSTVNAKLESGSVSQEVIVKATTSLLQAEDASLGQTIDGSTIDDLPLNGRNWLSLGQLAAGVATTPIGQPVAAGGTSESTFYSVNGVNFWQNDIRLNGINNNIEIFGGATGNSNATVNPPPDAIQEFRIQTGNGNAEFGHSTGAVINAVIKSGTNNLHGDVWEYLRNERLDANDYFSKQKNVPKPEYRQNQFGFTLGGPVILPKIYNGRNHTFFFVDYQGLRLIQPATATDTVPTLAMKQSGFTDLRDLITDSSGTRTDALGRTFRYGTILDPATTRSITAGSIDPVTGLQNTTKSTIYVRDPFFAGGSVGGIKDFTSLTSQLNQLSASRLDPNAVALLNLFPAPNNSGTNNTGLSGNYFVNPKTVTTSDQFDIKIDEKISDRDSLFGAFDRYTNTQVIPPALPGIANGHSGGQTQFLPGYMASLGYTRVLTSTLMNEFHAGYGHSVKNQLLDDGNHLGIPEQFGIQGIPQVPNNGGLPEISISGLTGLGISTYRPTVSTVWDLELTENVTKLYRTHAFKMGAQWDSLEGDILQPPNSKGAFTFNGQYTDVPNNFSGTVNGIGDMLILQGKTTIASAPGTAGISSLGGPSTVNGNNYSGSNYHRYYFGGYFQDDWKVFPNLTLNLGLRYDYFTPYVETSGRQANFLPDGGNGITATYYMPKKGCETPTSASFVSLLAASNIKLVCTDGLSVGQMQKNNFAPRLGFAYRATNTTVIRGGYGIAYGALGNIGYSGTLGTNYPFTYGLKFTSTTSQNPMLLSNGQPGTLENTFGIVNLQDPTSVNGQGLSMFGRQWYFQSPYIQTFNLTVQNQFAQHDSIQIGYVGTVGRHLDNLGTTNQPTQILTPSTSVATYLPYPQLAQGAFYETTNGSSSYNALQTTYEHTLSAGIRILGNYTYSKCFTDQRALNSATSAYRAQWLPGFGVTGDYGLCDTDSTHIVHASGTWVLPVGRGRRLLGSSNAVFDAILGGWSSNYIFTYQSGQPLTISCPTKTTSNFGCFANVVPGVNRYAGPHNIHQWLNPKAFSNPPVAVTNGQTDYSPLGGQPQQARGPGFANLDASLFKAFRFTDSMRLQIRAEAFNVTNTPHFGQPGSLNFGTPSTFSAITSLRGTPRIMQFAAKLYF